MPRLALAANWTVVPPRMVLILFRLNSPALLPAVTPNVVPAGTVRPGLFQSDVRTAVLPRTSPAGDRGGAAVVGVGIGQQQRAAGDVQAADAGQYAVVRRAAIGRTGDIQQHAAAREIGQAQSAAAQQAADIGGPQARSKDQPAVGGVVHHGAALQGAHATHFDRAGGNGGHAGVGVRAGEEQGTQPGLRHAPGADKVAAERDIPGVAVGIGRLDRNAAGGAAYKAGGNGRGPIGQGAKRSVAKLDAGGKRRTGIAKNHALRAHIETAGSEVYCPGSGGAAGLSEGDLLDLGRAAGEQ